MERQTISDVQAKELLVTGDGVIVNAGQLERLLTERDTLRAELAAAKEQSWQLEALIVDAHFRAFGARHYAYVDPKSACDLLVADIAATQHERDKAEAENDALKAHVERLRGAINTAIACLPTEGLYGNRIGLPAVRAQLSTALTATPAQSLAKLRAETLREACKDREHGGLCQRAVVDYLDWTGKEPLSSQLRSRPMFRLSALDAGEVMKMADRLEKEAAELPANRGTGENHES